MSRVPRAPSAPSAPMLGDESPDAAEHRSGHHDRAAGRPVGLLEQDALGRAAVARPRHAAAPRTRVRGDGAPLLALDALYHDGVVGSDVDVSFVGTFRRHSGAATTPGEAGERRDALGRRRPRPSPLPCTRAPAIRAPLAQHVRFTCVEFCLLRCVYVRRIVWHASQSNLPYITSSRGDLTLHKSCTCSDALKDSPNHHHTHTHTTPRPTRNQT